MKTREDFEFLRKEMSRKASSQQHSAANPLKSVWVEASAGTGKTKVLSDRVLRLLLDGVKPQRILCLTYTKAAAVEMNTRISERLSKWSVQTDEKLEENLFELLGKEMADTKLLLKYKNRARTLFAVLLDTPGGIKIQTIHSFCQEVLKRFPLEAGISPYFDILDDESSADALKQIQKELLETTEYGADCPLKDALMFLTENLSEYSFPKVMKNITINRSKLSEMFAMYPSQKDLLSKLAHSLQISMDDTEQTVISEFMKNINYDDLRKNVVALLNGGKKDSERAEKMEKFIIEKGNFNNYQDYKNLFLNKDGTIPQKLADKKSISADSFLAERLGKECERILQNEEKLCKIRLYQSTKSVLIITRELNLRYNNFKKLYSKLDYEDLILLTRHLLSDSAVASWVLFKLDGGIDHILIDEAQDTSPNQWDIIKSLSEEFFAGKGTNDRKRTVFAVGDRKQSIYSFQGADPDKFDRMSAYFSEKAAPDFQKVNLEVSFRSVSPVLETVNKIFAKENVSEGVTAQGETVHHVPFRRGEAGKVEVWPLLVADKKSKSSEDDWLPPFEMSQETSVKKKLALMMAEKIKELVDKENFHYRDIMVLVQTRNSFVEEFIRACKDNQVNINGADKLRLSEQIAVQDLVSLGRFLLLPNDDLSLAEVLKSPLFGLSDEDLWKICAKRGNAPVWSKLGDFSQYAEIYADLQNLLNMLDFVRPYELFNYVLTKMNGRYKFTERMGMEVEDALDEFINLTISYEQTHIPSLQGFIDWIGRTEVEIKRETEQKGNDAVRLMTVHGSKGLQAPVVFMPDTVRIKNIKNEQALLWKDNLAYYPLNSECYDETCLQIKEENSKKSFEEYRRLLYVALTRAEDRLYICGFSNKENADARSWYGICQETLQENGEKNGEILEIKAPEIFAKKTEDKKSAETKMPNPETWIYQNAEKESLLSKPYTPSHGEEEIDADSSSPLSENGNFYLRGAIIHKLLQFLPQNNENKESLIEEYLEKNAEDLSIFQKKQIKTEVLNLLNNVEFAEIFGKNSKPEVPIMGEVDGKIVSAQLDRLVILPDKVLIVDFKTNRPAAQTLENTPATYINQLSMYAKLLNKIYQGKRVETYILWTNEARLMRVS